MLNQFNNKQITALTKRYSSECRTISDERIWQP